ncbi:MAG: GtrA family protein [Methyloglobulus sp.]|nr:GtrA family protein [Methyloglobulus sp.]
MQNLSQKIAGIAEQQETKWHHYLPNFGQPIASIAISLDGTCMHISKDRKHFIKFLKYVLVGLSAAILDFGIFIACLKLLHNSSGGIFTNFSKIESTTVANALGITSGFLWSFILNRYWAFRSTGYPLTQFVSMIALVFVNIVITSFFIPLLSGGLNIKLEWAKVIMQIAVVGWNYLIYHHLIFKNR